MFRAQLPRLYDLRDLTADTASRDAYFHDFEALLRDELARAAFVRWEQKLQCLDGDAWKALKDEASQYLTRRDACRGYYQLFDVLGQADGYEHLRNIGCSKVWFIPRSDKQGRKTPDLEGSLDSQRVLCEVKNINISEAETRARRESTVRGIATRLGEGFFRKLRSDITHAKDQLRSYDPMSEARHLAYISMCFDDWVGYCKEDYLRQIEQYLKDNPIPEIEIFFSAASQ
jgi:hypothetical protein